MLFRHWHVRPFALGWIRFPRDTQVVVGEIVLGAVLIVILADGIEAHRDRQLRHIQFRLRLLGALDVGLDPPPIFDVRLLRHRTTLLRGWGWFTSKSLPAKACPPDRILRATDYLVDYACDQPRARRVTRRGAATTLRRRARPAVRATLEFLPMPARSCLVRRAVSVRLAPILRVPALRVPPLRVADARAVCALLVAATRERFGARLNPRTIRHVKVSALVSASVQNR